MSAFFVDQIAPPGYEIYEPENRKCLPQRKLDAKPCRASDNRNLHVAHREHDARQNYYILLQSAGPSSWLHRGPRRSIERRLLATTDALPSLQPQESRQREAFVRQELFLGCCTARQQGFQVASE